MQLQSGSGNLPRSYRARMAPPGPTWTVQLHQSVGLGKRPRSGGWYQTSFRCLNVKHTSGNMMSRHGVGQPTAIVCWTTPSRILARRAQHQCHRLQVGHGAMPEQYGLAMQRRRYCLGDCGGVGPTHRCSHRNVFPPGHQELLPSGSPVWDFVVVVLPENVFRPR